MKTAVLGLYAYAWDVLDEGPDAVLDGVERAGLNSLYLAVWYHSGMFFLPHNPARRVYFPVPGALYFKPGDWIRDHPLAPPVSSLSDSWPKFWEELAERAERRGISLSAWMPVFHNSGIGTSYPDVAVENPWGDRIFHTICPSNEQVADLARSVAADIAGRGIFDRILLESVEYLPLRHDHHHEVIGVPLGAEAEFLASLCFCPACRERQMRDGIDFDGVRDWTRRQVDSASSARPAVPFEWERLEGGADGQFGGYLRVRESGVSEATENIAGAIRAAAPDITIAALDFGPLYPLGPNGRKWQNGVDLDHLLPLVDEIHPTYYFTDQAVLADRFETYNALIRGEAAQVPAIRAILPQVSSEDELGAQVRAVASASNGYTFYNYSFIDLATLDWIRGSVENYPPESGDE